MKGIVISQSYYNNLDHLVIEDIENHTISECCVDRLDKNYVGKTVSIYTQVSEIINSDFSHVYPKGTIGTC